MRFPTSILIALMIPVISCDGKKTRSSSGKTYISRTVTFRNDNDGIKLAGTLTIPLNAKRHPAVVLIHGSGPSTRDLSLGHISLFKEIADHLTRIGLVVLRYDKRGVEQSEGDYEEYDINAFSSDGLAAVSYLRTLDEVDPLKVGALGISQGGLIVPIMAKQDLKIAFIIMLAGPGIWGKEFFRLSSVAIAKASGYGETAAKEIEALYDRFWPLYTKENLTEQEKENAKHILWQISQYMDQANRKVLNLTDINGYFSFMRSPYILKWMDYDPATVLSQVRCPVLALNGARDVQTSSLENLAAIETALQTSGNKNYTVIELEGLNHVFSRCKTGLPTEYFSTDQSISLNMLRIIGDWICKITAYNKN